MNTALLSPEELLVWSDPDGGQTRVTLALSPLGLQAAARQRPGSAWTVTAAVQRYCWSNTGAAAAGPAGPTPGLAGAAGSPPGSAGSLSGPPGAAEARAAEPAGAAEAHSAGNIEIERLSKRTLPKIQDDGVL